MLIVLLALFQGGIAVQINKCCPVGQRLDVPTKICSAHNRSDDGNYNLPPTNIQLVYNGNPCPSDKSEIFRFNQDTDIFIDGDLVLDPGPDNITYPRSSYCLDYVGSILIVKLCPCRLAICVRKCCSDDEVLDITDGIQKGSCVNNETLAEDWEPNISKKGNFLR